MGQEESTIVDESKPSVTLESRTVEGVGKYLRNGRAKEVVVMVGAGISTSAGIPDFRSPDTGLYANLARLDLPYAEAVFDIEYFRKNPLPFYTLAQELYPGKYRPTIAHSFIKLLHNKGILLKLFTQNIDCLEREAGVPDDKIVEAHGSFAKQRCIDCQSPYPDDKMRKAIQDKEVPRCLNGDCNGLVKPDIVFFGEKLPSEFFENRGKAARADLAIVMGTSLTVQPFASLPGFVSVNVPRVLVNKEQVGSLGSRSDDVLVLGDCDDGVRKLAKACGWLEELEELWRMTVPKAAADLGRQPEEAKSKDELVEEEIEKLTKDVDETLRISSNLLRDEPRRSDDQPSSSPAPAALEPEPEKVLEHSPEMGNVLDTSSESKKQVPDQITRDETPKVPQKHLHEGGLAHVFPHMGSKGSL
ncbi:NAD-dependent histone deacetylase SIR2 [Phyllosticta citribraziliensis]|uniref:NAD-dependent histone deacetylase SIR2 n=1 Tax=Phyllosticta citribraziliensis TaxID=989973 RepID=A0ABR1LDN0_9PEZI